MTRIITWNVNGLRAVEKKGFLSWLDSESPDILCIQETKAKPQQLSEALKEPGSYYSYWESAKKPGYSGLVTYSKEKVEDVENLGVSDFDIEGRVQILYYPSFVLVNAYFPNSQDKGRRVDYKLAFCQAMLEKLDSLVDAGYNVILSGDYNIAHTAIDLKNPDTNVGSPGFLPEERAWMDSFIAAGYVDAFRLFTDEGGHYTWWSYRTRARERNAGWRIDYHAVNAAMKDEVVACTILSDVPGSDHCPVRLELLPELG